jgi:hypothetical protein
LTTEVVRGVWNDVVLKVKVSRGRIGMWLARTVLEKADANRLTIAFPQTVGRFERQQLEIPENRQIIEKCATEVLGRPMLVVFNANSTVAAPEAAPEPTPPTPRHEDVYTDPIVRKALELFDGRVVNIEEKR